MMYRFFSATMAAAIVAVIGTVLSSASAAITTYTGELTTTDSNFNKPIIFPPFDPPFLLVTSETRRWAYDTYTFTAEASGPYSISSTYVLDTPLVDHPLDGAIYLYASTFDPANPVTNLVAAADDLPSAVSGDATARSGSLMPSSRTFGSSSVVTTDSTTGAKVLSLTAGTTYVVVQTSDKAFNDSDPANVRLATGSYTLVINSGVGSVPEPTSVGIGSIVLCGLSRRRRSV